jgi:hypothetical protein
MILGTYDFSQKMRKAHFSSFEFGVTYGAPLEEEPVYENESSYWFGPRGLIGGDRL